MNGVEEIYVMCNRVRWQNSFFSVPVTRDDNFSYRRRVTEGCQINPKDELYSERKILRWQTEFTLAHFDREVNAFDENENISSAESDFSEEPSLCLDDSNDESMYSECENQYLQLRVSQSQPDTKTLCLSQHQQDTDSDILQHNPTVQEGEDWEPSEFVSQYCDVDLLVTEKVRDLSEVYMTARPPAHQHNQHSRRRSREAGGESSAMYDKKYSLDSDYREYYRDRPRGEFLTRGAALSSQSGAGAAAGASRAAAHEPTYGSSGTRRQQAELSQPQYQQVSSTAVARIGRNASSEKIATARNPTILRKKLDVCVYLMSAVAVQMEVEEGANATVTELLTSLLEEEELGLPRVTQEVLTLWMISPLLEVQLKPHHKPFFIRREWNHFLQRFSSANQDQKAGDEPVLSLQRNVFCPRREEHNLKDHRILELLYEEAKYNILTGRYPCEISDYIMLGGIQARLEIGPYDLAIHTPAFFRQNLERFMPEHAVRKTGGILSWLPWSANSKSSAEARLIEQFKAIPSNASPKRLVRKYLEFCWSLPYYGSAFFRGQIETPAKSLTSLVINQDTEVIIAINNQGLHVIDPTNVVVLLGLKFEELSWDYAKPSQENNEDCLPCLFIQFCVIENGRRVSKILQVFSRQAVQMDALISAFVDEIKQKAALYSEEGENLYNENSAETDECLVPLTTVSRRGIPESCLSNKLTRLTLATFDDEGHCIGHMGSWSFSS